MARRNKDSFTSARRRGGRRASTLLSKLLLWGLITLGALLLLGFIGYTRVIAYLQGESFRDTMEAALANKAQATSAEIEGTLSIEDNHLSLPGVTMERPGVLRAVSGRNIHAEIRRGALLDGELYFTRLMVEEGRLSLKVEDKGTTSSRKPAAPGSSTAPEAVGTAEPAPHSRGKGLLSRLAPRQARLDRMECKNFNMELALGDRLFSLSDSTLAATPAGAPGKLSAKSPWEFRLTNGRIHTPLPIIADCSLKTATLTLGGKHSSLSDARFMFSPGELVINAVRENASGKWSADIRSNSVDISRFIGEDWKKRVGGVFYGRLRAEGDARGIAKAEGNVSLQQGVLEALPFLSNIAVGNTYPYRHIKLEKATGRLSYPHADAARNVRQAWVLDDIDLRAEGGWLRVQGHAFVDADSTLGGSLLIGLPENVATRFVPADSALYRRIFNASGEAGYCWLRLNLSGTLKSPQEDLSVRLKTLLVPASLPEAADLIKTLLSPSREAPAPATEETEPEAPAPTQPSGIIREAGDAASGLLRKLF